MLDHVAQQKREWRVIDAGIELWRMKVPKLAGDASTSDAEINEIDLEVSPAPPAAKLHELF
ncbi:MAG: hypothetical protein ABI551_10380, partial [Polyangiaceae bacterium]